MASRRIESPSTVDEALFQTISDALDGSRIEAVPPKEPSYEVLHYRTGMTNPRARIAAHPARPLNVVGAVARFVWMVAGSNRLHDILYYESKVRDYTDNGLTVPGSSYGRRLFDPAPGLDQIHGVIGRLRRDHHTRQAAAVVWAAEDAVRESRDIPCTFGMLFHIRGEQLVMCAIMRSNNAFRLLTYNFFEFSLLGETIAATLDLPFGEYVHFAGSMHVYDTGEMGATRQVVEDGPGVSVEMPPMPGTDQTRLAAAERAGDMREQDLATAIGQTTELARLEAQLRHAHNAADIDSVRADAAERLNSYWLGLFNVLLAWGAAKRELPDLVAEVFDQLPEYLRAPTRASIARAMPDLGPAPAAEGDQEAMFDIAEDLPRISSVAAAAAEAEYEATAKAALQAVVSYHENVEALPVADFPKLVDILTEGGAAMAARSESPADGTRDDRFSFPVETIRAALDQLK